MPVVRVIRGGVTETRRKPGRTMITKLLCRHNGELFMRTEILLTIVAPPNRVMAG